MLKKPNVAEYLLEPHSADFTRRPAIFEHILSRVTTGGGGGGGGGREGGREGGRGEGRGKIRR
jgi:hypothetical protein